MYPPTTVTAYAHGKINLHLGVGSLRSDGYHDLVTIFQSVDRHDVVTLEVMDGLPGEILELTCATRGVPTDETNLAWRAVAAVFAAAPDPAALPAVCIDITKKIPTAGGMAGGSADAAAALLAANHLIGAPLTKEELLKLAADLGSDVPFTLLGGTAIGTGRGENLTTVLNRATLHWVLAFSSAGLSTPDVFRTLDTLGHTPHLDSTELQQALAAGNPETIAGLLHNDLQPAAISLQPEIRTTLRLGEEAGALAGIVSGSGPTCAFLCADAQSAQEVAAELSLHSAVAVTTSPAKGAYLEEY
ncbi:MAG: 4-(cytidine 5'-diphospho)-2-C-methyl-D-erythritol kinase [Corynebacterium sp.]|uniref:4-(cytidine 5'-diphospho)-2-C-methyl-D-erythritol kinase n=1 Tax=Corynebacterium sp. TaxID=1720 RepID=UPI0026DCB8D0|nr:4-(cytidine 5'-diphospho)-2-C-methyl-D-erythritol kinase [Corynebacterium sp.]MDO5097265.1 4-(cytidine 5'-diphospho)-2-C-methyl-D-erythritol kinase [Corynebacterium sp.]